ncbi:hypothetical protein D3C77_741420 [compost metagenome]
MPASRRVMAKTFFRFTLFICFFGRLSTGTISFQLSFMSCSENSGGTSGVFWM